MQFCRLRKRVERISFIVSKNTKQNKAKTVSLYFDLLKKHFKGCSSNPTYKGDDGCFFLKTSVLSYNTYTET